MQPQLTVCSDCSTAAFATGVDVLFSATGASWEVQAAGTRANSRMARFFMGRFRLGPSAGVGSVGFDCGTRPGILVNYGTSTGALS